MKHADVRRMAALALAEDAARRDCSSSAISPSVRAMAGIVAEQDLVVSGMDLARAVFRCCDAGSHVVSAARDGQVLSPGRVILRVRGCARRLMAAERTALNFLAHLSGIATLTRQYVSAVPRGCRACILDTRKTTPLYRVLEKAAVKHGGGTNHRMDLADAVLLKDNHVAILGGVARAVRSTRAQVGRKMKIEVEVSTIGELREAIDAGADRVLLDNMSDAMVRRAVKIVAGRIPVEASGGVTLKRIPRLARAGVDFISVGALTHSAPAARISMDVCIIG